jgi:pyruvate kinase
MNFRKTKIICTIGPSSSDVDSLIKLINAGMNAARLNFSHGTHEEHFRTIENVRKASEQTGRDIAIIQDLQGPKIRVGRFENGYAELNDGGEFVITSEALEYGNSRIVSTSYEQLADDLRPGSKLLLDDGYIILKVTSIKGMEIRTEVIKGGILRDNKGIIAPGASISAEPLSEKDIEDLKFGLDAGIDLVALSFVRSEKDVLELKTTMKLFKRSVPIISKIERFEGYEDLDDIIEESDGIMVARGDLGLEMPAEEVPIIQKEIIRRCNQAGKPVITATQMLESMINNPMPTRAEASDVANAVLDGTDCVMLSGETSIGKYPVETVEYMDRIIRMIEKHSKTLRNTNTMNILPGSSINNALGKASFVLAEQISADALVALTKSGYTAMSIAKYKPATPIFAITDNIKTLRYLNIVCGVVPIAIQEGKSLDSILDSPDEYLTNSSIIYDGLIVLVSGLSEGTIKPRNMIKVIHT